MNVGQAIRDLRKQRGLTQQQLADAVGCTDAAIRNYESNARTLKGDTLMRIAEALEVTPSSLVDHGVESARDFLALIFQVEDEFKFMPVESEEGLAIGMAHDCDMAPKLQVALKAWQKQREALEAGEISTVEYELWKVGFEA